MEALANFQPLTTGTATLIWKILMVSAMGALLYLAHGRFVSASLKNRNALLTAILLPPIALTITTGIATNVFLSLGMIGALSIIRYRTPVKSQYELAMLFALITLGIVGVVSLANCIVMFAFLILIAAIWPVIQNMFPDSFLNAEAARLDDRPSLTLSFSGALKDFGTLEGEIQNMDVKRENEAVVTTCVLAFNTMDQALKAQENLAGDTRVTSVSVARKIRKG